MKTRVFGSQNLSQKAGFSGSSKPGCGHPIYGYFLLKKRHIFKTRKPGFSGCKICPKKPGFRVRVNPGGHPTRKDFLLVSPKKS